jgi:stage IV sporulation protein FB
VFLLEPQRTAFDLNWQMFGTSIRVHPMFWVFSAVLGWQWQRLGIEYLLIWIACVFVSILVHEFGHVFAGRIFGRESAIVLYTFGGLAIGANNLPRRWQRILVCLAGPAAGLALFGLVFMIALFRPEIQSRLVWFALGRLAWINLAWSVLNLIPIWPLDGGQVSREALSGIFPGNGLRLSLGISFLLAALLAIHAIMEQNGRPLFPWLPIGGTYTAILFGLLALESFQLLQQAERNRRYWHQDEGTPWERDPTIWRR